MCWSTCSSLVSHWPCRSPAMAMRSSAKPVPRLSPSCNRRGKRLVFAAAQHTGPGAGGDSPASADLPATIRELRQQRNAVIL
ncbi:MAG: hypothetical protein ACK56F_07795, partial [bacterium]